ncbi:hypothetical protein F2Q68_00019147 [Brassica cretica]|uniref:3-dehydroquinate synthase domain-containing protein n=1 Tax=Brassica cretica TaxID=69181 RepID=A0A8S9FZ99_BRACR|nr:hypothetical protein F2Q68_00019147 [Brassica cretica]
MAANAVSLSISSPKTLHSLEAQTRGLIPPPTISFPKSSSSLSSTAISISRSRVRAGPSQLVNEPANAMATPPTIVEVDLGSRSYPIYIGAGLLDQSHLLQRHVHGKKVLVVTNERVAPLYLDKTVDSSVGGKTGINHRLGKNLIGAFYQPQCVLVDTDTLNTLPDREMASGLAEVIKYGLIRDADFFEWQEKNIEALLARDPAALAYAIKRSCENKADVVSQDEKESGLRATLNLGHTFGHAIETGFGYGEWLHGEAVAAGTVMAVDMSHRLGWIDDSIVERVNNILKRAKLPTTPPESMTVSMFKSIMAVDKKVADGLLRLILLKGPLGNCVFTGDYDREALDATLRAFSKS